jgi:hypothetical protein
VVPVVDHILLEEVDTDLDWVEEEDILDCIVLVEDILQVGLDMAIVRREVELVVGRYNLPVAVHSLVEEGVARILLVGVPEEDILEEVLDNTTFPLKLDDDDGSSRTIDSELNMVKVGGMFPIST